MWEIQSQDDVQRRLKKYQKKWPHEMKNVFENLETIRLAILEGAHLEQLKDLGFVHSEPYEIIAIDQKGPGKKTKMKAFRLYVYLEQAEKIVHLITLGDKSTQSKDIAYATQFARRLIRNHQQEGEFPDEAEAG